MEVLAPGAQIVAGQLISVGGEGGGRVPGRGVADGRSEDNHRVEPDRSAGHGRQLTMGSSPTGAMLSRVM